MGLLTFKIKGQAKKFKVNGQKVKYYRGAAVNSPREDLFLKDLA